jgi:hypothetical protein
MKYEIEIDFVQTYKMIVEAPTLMNAEMYGDNIDMEEFDKVRAEAGRSGTGELPSYVGFRTIGRNAKRLKTAFG